MKRRWTRALPLVFLPGCALFGGGSLDLAAVTQNLSNIQQLTAENDEAFAKLGEAASMKAVRQGRNDAAVLLGRKIVEGASK